MEDRCANCYTHLEKRRKCAKCRSRLFCSRACQVEDWTDGNHKLYCERTGEVPGKGRGLIAQRRFAKWGKILVERPILQYMSGTIPCWDLAEVEGDGRRELLALLHPQDGTL